MRTIPIALEAHYESGATSLARLWRIERTDGVVFGFTDHDANITFSGLVYRTTSAFDASAISSSADLSVDNLEVLGVLDEDGIEAEDIEAGLWDGASIVVREVCWADLTKGAVILRAGTIGNVQRKRGQYVAEMRGLLQSLQNTIGDIVDARCNATLGDSRCGIDLGGSPTWRGTGSVTSASSRRAFLASGPLFASGFFDYGTVRFTSGANAGLSMEIKQHLLGHSPAEASFALQLAMPFDIQAGDAFVATRGCDHTAATCKAVFGNLVNFRGFPSVPGQDQALLFGGQG